jgi:hypothetical protein
MHVDAKAGSEYGAVAGARPGCGVAAQPTRSRRNHMSTDLRHAAILSLGVLFVIAATDASAADQYRRWLDDGKSYTCTTIGPGTVQILMSNQNVEFNNLPADAQYTLNYFDNGVLVHSDGPYTVEQTSGTLNYGPFAEPMSGYPARFDFRMDTLIDSVVVYRSTATATCNADTAAPLPVVISNLDGPFPVPATSPMALGLLALALGLLGSVLIRRALA